MDASEFVAKLQADPEYLEQKAAVEADRQKLEREERRASAPLLRDLKRVGVEISSIWNLVNTAEPYSAALPILVKHLQQRRYPDMLRQGIARAWQYANPSSRGRYSSPLSGQSSTIVRTGSSGRSRAPSLLRPMTR